MIFSKSKCDGCWNLPDYGEKSRVTRMVSHVLGGCLGEVCNPHKDTEAQVGGCGGWEIKEFIKAHTDIKFFL